MKAIIMAGGEGTRLRPMTLARPKPMIRLLDRPVLEYILVLLRENGFDDVCLTLKYMPDAVTAYFGDGGGLGVRLQSRVESEPLGTAGSVRACMDFIGDDDVLIMSGDCVCDFNLRDCAEFHKRSGAEATVVLYSHPDPTEYGVVVTGARGRVEGFREKPPWEEVVAGDVSAGIYILSPEAARRIPEGLPYDFGRDLFPLMLREGAPLYAVRADGYWCDIGSPSAYLRCCADVLAGSVRLPMKAPKTRGGVWAGSVIPGNAVAAPPVYVGENVIVESGAHLGPNAVIGSGSFIGRGASIKNSVIDGAAVKARAASAGAVVCEGATVNEGASLCEGSVIGDKSVIGRGAIISRRARIWPACDIPEGARVSESVVDGMPKGGPAFSQGGVIRGGFDSELTPEACIAIGSAAASFGECGIADDGSTAARTLADAVSCGVRASGGCATRLDAPFAAAASFGGGLYGLAVTIFVSCAEGGAALRFFGSGGLSVTRAEERRFEAALRGDTKRVLSHAVGDSQRASGICGALSAAAAAGAGCGGVTVSLTGRSGACRTMRAALAFAGCAVTVPRRGVPAVIPAADGFSLALDDENGRRLDADRAVLLTAAAAFYTGETEIAAPLTAPSALDKLAAQFNARVLRLGRDDGAEALLLRQPFMRYAPFAAVRICRAMSEKRATLAALCDRLPAFSSAVREVPVSKPRGDVMSALRASYAEFAAELGGGLRAEVKGGSVSVSPCREREALLIRAEGESEELAEELCADFLRRASEADAKE